MFSIRSHRVRGMVARDMWYVLPQRGAETQMKVGDLVFYAGDSRAVGVITTILRHTCEVHWSDGEHTYTYKYNLEVQCK